VIGTNLVASHVNNSRLSRPFLLFSLEWVVAIG